MRVAEREKFLLDIKRNKCSPLRKSGGYYSACATSRVALMRWPVVCLPHAKNFAFWLRL